MSVKTRNLGLEIYYLFNGRDFIVNENLGDTEFQEILHFCRENDPDWVIKKTREGTVSMKSMPSCRFLFFKE